MKKYFFLLLLITASYSLWSQNIDSLKTVLSNKQKELDALNIEAGKLNGQIAPLKDQIGLLKQVIKPWHFGGFACLNINQSSFTNWAAGGENSISATLLGNAYADYAKKKNTWHNALDANWGLIRSHKETRKNVDVLKLSSNYGYKLSAKGFFAAANLDALSQITHTRDYADTANHQPVVSAFAAPAYIKLALGIDYKPKKWISFFISPATGKFTIVRKNLGIDPTTYGVAAGKSMRSEFGASFKAALDKDLVKNVNLKTSLELFNNYTDPIRNQRANIDVNWLTMISMKVNKYISASLSTQLIYDNDIKINVDRNDDGEIDGTGPRTQFAENFGVGFSYKF